MRISLTYQGALVEFSRQQRLNKTVQNIADPLVVREISFVKNGEAVKLTLSDEYIEIKNDIYEFLEKDANVQNADPDDVFSYRPRDQWLVFSQFLYDESFFDSCSKGEMGQMESMLQKITAGLDSLTQQGIDFFDSNIKTQLHSYEAQLELASSVSALSYFSDKFLTGDIKKGFDRLIGDYANHNAKKLENYKSIEERFLASRAKLYSVNASLSPQAAGELAITNKLGKINHSKEEVGDLAQKYTEMFDIMKAQGDLSPLAEVRAQLLTFVLKDISKNNPDYGGAKKFIDARVEDTFNRLKDYWEALL